MVSPVRLRERLEALVTYFNQASLDVPDDLLSRQCVFRLNGLAYEDTLGRPVSDPLVRLIARGPAGYRFLAQWLRFAMPDAQASLHLAACDAGLATGVAVLRGTLRGSTDAFEVRADVALLVEEAGRLGEVAVVVDEGMLARLELARRAA